MAKRSKTYRGKRAYRNAKHHPCGCFLCVGHDVYYKYEQLEKEALKEIKDYEQRN